MKIGVNLKFSEKIGMIFSFTSLRLSRTTKTRNMEFDDKIDKTCLFQISGVLAETRKESPNLKIHKVKSI